MDHLSRALHAMTSQEVARGNAAAAAAELRQRRLELEDADAYLLTLPWRRASAAGQAHDVAGRASP